MRVREHEGCLRVMLQRNNTKLYLIPKKVPSNMTIGLEGF